MLFRGCVITLFFTTMHGLVDTLQKAKQLSAYLTNIPAYHPTNELESLNGLRRTIADIEANQHHYQTLLTQYHQVCLRRNELIAGTPESINQLLTLLTPSVIQQLTRRDPRKRSELMKSLRFLKRHGRPACPVDIMHPVFQRKHQSFKKLHALLFDRYENVITNLRALLPINSPLFPLLQLENTYHQLRQLTTTLNEIEALIQIRYQQQSDHFHQVKMRLSAIRNRGQYLKIIPSSNAISSLPSGGSRQLFTTLIRS